MPNDPTQSGEQPATEVHGSSAFVPTEIPSGAGPHSPVPSRPPTATSSLTATRAAGSGTGSSPATPSSEVNKTNEPRRAGGGTAIEDVSTDKALRAAKRINYQGKDYPSLAGIPLMRKLGQGGMGAVYYGVHPRLQNEVAVKILPVHLMEENPTLVERFLREARIAAQIQSPHLVAVQDVNEEAGLYYLVMEFVNGLSGAKYLSNVKKEGKTGLPEIEASEIIEAACDGLRVAHSASIVHRDIKPDNIMIPFKNKKTKELELRSAKVMDLGLARHVEGEGGDESKDALTGAQVAMGTPGYMAPEQIMDARKASMRSDVFSMGASLYALLAGQSPFHKDTSMQTVMATMEANPEPLGKIRADVSLYMVAVIDKCLKKNPAERYADAGELLQDLKKARLAGKGASPPPDATLIQGAPSAWKPATSAGGATPVPGTDPSGAAIAPPKKKGFGLIGAAAAVVLLVGGGGFFALRSGKPDLAPLLLEVREKLASQQINEAESQLNLLDKDYPKDQSITDLRKKIETMRKEAEEQDKLMFSDVEPYLKQAEKAMALAEETKTTGPLSTALTKLAVARKILPNNAKIAEAQKKLDKMKVAFADLEAKQQKKQEFEALLKEFDALIEKSDSISDATKKIAAAEGMFPDDPALKERQQKLLQKHANVKKLNALIRVAGASLEADDVGEAESKLAEAQAISPNDARLVALLGKLRTKKEAQEKETRERREKFDGYIKDAVAIIDSKGKLADADRKIREAELLFGTDPAIAATRAKLNAQRSAAEREAAEKQRRLDTLASLADILKTDNLKDALKQIELAEKDYPKDQEVAALRASYETRKKEADEKARRKNFDGFVAKADDLLKKAEPDLVEVAGVIDEAKGLYPADPKIKDLDKLLAEKKEEARKRIADQQKRDRFDGLVKKVEDILKSGELSEAQLNDADAKLASAKQVFADEPNRAEPKYSQLFADVEKKRKSYTLNKIKDALAKNDLATAELSIKEAEFSYKGDNDLGKLRTDLDKKKSDKAALAQRESARKALLAKVDEALKKGDLIEAAKQFEIVDKDFASDAVFDAPRKLLKDGQTKQKKRKDALDGLDALLAGGDLAKLAAQLPVVEKAYLQDAEVAKRRALFGEKQKAETRKGLLKDAGDALAKADLQTAFQKLTQADKDFPKDPEFAPLLAKYNQLVQEDRAKKEHDSLLAGLKAAVDQGSSLTDAQSKFDTFKAKFPADPELPNLQTSLQAKIKAAGDAQAAEARRRADLERQQKAETAAMNIRNLIKKKSKDDAQRALDAAKTLLDAGTVASFEREISALGSKPVSRPVTPSKTDDPPRE